MSDAGALLGMGFTATILLTLLASLLPLRCIKRKGWLR